MSTYDIESHPDIRGWGIDVDPANNPAYPMRDPAGAQASDSRPAQQPQSVEILKSTERPTISAVFGTATPPRGLSGLIRRRAFKYSEASWTHWLMLLFADRVNVLEGVFQDVSRGRIPNVFSEMGLKSEWKYNRISLVKKGVAAAAIGGVAYLLIRACRHR